MEHSNTCVISKSNNNWYRHLPNSNYRWVSVLLDSVNLVCTFNPVVVFGNTWQYSVMYCTCDNTDMRKCL